MKRLIVFDLDGTLAKSKTSLDAEMSSLIHALLGIVRVAVISGGAWPQFEAQVLAELPRDERLMRMSLLPTCGTKFFAYEGAWTRALFRGSLRRREGEDRRRSEKVARGGRLQDRAGLGRRD